MSLVSKKAFYSFENLWNSTTQLFATDRTSWTTKIALSALAFGTLCLLVEGGRRLYSYSTSAPVIKKPSSDLTSAIQETSSVPSSDHSFFRISGKNIPPDCQILLLGTRELPLEKYPENICQKLKSCKRLATNFPVKQLPHPARGQLIINTLALTIDNLKKQDIDWFSGQFKIIGYSGEDLEKRITLTKSMKTVADLTLQSWQENLSSKVIVDIPIQLKAYPYNLWEIHPAMFIYLLDNEVVNMFEFQRDGMQQEVYQFFGDGRISFPETEIMTASLIDEFISQMSDFLTSPDKCAQTMKTFCEQLNSDTEVEDLEMLDTFHDRFTVQGRRLDQPNPKIETLCSTIIAKNLAWQPKILEILQQEISTAIVIPNEHLVIDWDADTGIIQFLLNEGYTVQAES